MPEELTPTARTILGFLASHPRSGYEIREAAKRAVSFFWGVSDGQLYPQLKLLAARNLIEAVEQPDTGPRARQVWRLTPDGRAAFLAWLREPSAPRQTRDENLVKILFAAQLDRAEAPTRARRRRASPIRPASSRRPTAPDWPISPLYHRSRSRPSSSTTVRARMPGPVTSSSAGRSPSVTAAAPGSTSRRSRPTNAVTKKA